MAMVQYYDIKESVLQTKNIESGCLIVCNDTGNFYFETVSENPKRIRLNTIIIHDVIIPAGETKSIDCNGIMKSIDEGNIKFIIDKSIADINNLDKALSITIKENENNRIYIQNSSTYDIFGTIII